MDPEKGVALPNGFIPNTTDIPMSRSAATTILQPLVPFDLSGKQVLLSVGRMVKRKGHAWFVDAVMPRLDPSIVYVILGDGPERETVRRAVESHGLGNRVVLLGRQPDAVLDAAYAAADLFVMPNIPVHGDMEGFGIVLLEANATGLPAIGADLEGIRDVIRDGENGLKVAVADTDAWVEGIGTLLAQDPVVLRKRASDFVHERFDWATVADQYIQYLQEVTARYRSRSV
jgi:phosphatidylinositol alpha-1,6-mannosyltransferase